MQYAAHLPRIPSTRRMVAPVIALVVGAAAATGTYALIDNADEGVQGSKVIVVDRPAPGAGVRGLDDMTNGPSSTAITSQTGKQGYVNGLPAYPSPSPTVDEQVYVDPSTGYASGR
jgi:hypothetical protein